MPYFIEDFQTSLYDNRCRKREEMLMYSTMQFVDYFVSLGDDTATAQDKVAQVSTEVAAVLYAYVLGNKQPLIDGINNSSLPFMDAAAKSKLIGDLTAL